MLKNLRIFFATRILGKDIYIINLETEELIDYEIHRASGSNTYGTRMK